MSASLSYNPIDLQINPFSFDKMKQDWIPSAASLNPDFVLPDPHSSVFTVLTWNVWFDRLVWADRLEAVLLTIQTHNPDFVCLQEVTPRIVGNLLESEYVRNHFVVSGDPADLASNESKILGRYGVLILSRFPVEFFALHKMRSGQGRGLLVARSTWHGIPMAVSTIHLESEDQNAQRRMEQLIKSTNILEEMMVPRSIKLIMGDFNFHDTWPEQSAINSNYLDVWPHLKPGNPGFTEDTDINTMRLEVTRHSKQVRFDRILLNASPAGSSPLVEPSSIQLVGTQPIPGVVSDRVTRVFPSDHFGLVASFSLVSS